MAPLTKMVVIGLMAPLTKMVRVLILSVEIKAYWPSIRRKATGKNDRENLLLRLFNTEITEPFKALSLDSNREEYFRGEIGDEDFIKDISSNLSLIVQGIQKRYPTLECAPGIYRYEWNDSDMNWRPKIEVWKSIGEREDPYIAKRRARDDRFYLYLVYDPLTTYDATGRATKDLLRIQSQEELFKQTNADDVEERMNIGDYDVYGNNNGKVMNDNPDVDQSDMQRGIYKTGLQSNVILRSREEKMNTITRKIESMRNDILENELGLRPLFVNFLGASKFGVGQDLSTKQLINDDTDWRGAKSSAIDLDSIGQVDSKNHPGSAMELYSKDTSSAMELNLINAKNEQLLDPSPKHLHEEVVDASSKNEPSLSADHKESVKANPSSSGDYETPKDHDSKTDDHDTLPLHDESFKEKEKPSESLSKKTTESLSEKQNTSEKQNKSDKESEPQTTSIKEEDMTESKEGETESKEEEGQSMDPFTAGNTALKNTAVLLNIAENRETKEMKSSDVQQEDLELLRLTNMSRIGANLGAGDRSVIDIEFLKKIDHLPSMSETEFELVTAASKELVNAPREERKRWAFGKGDTEWEPFAENLQKRRSSSTKPKKEEFLDMEPEVETVSGFPVELQKKNAKYRSLSRLMVGMNGRFVSAGLLDNLITDVLEEAERDINDIKFQKDISANDQSYVDSKTILRQKLLPVLHNSIMTENFLGSDYDKLTPKLLIRLIGDYFRYLMRRRPERRGKRITYRFRNWKDCLEQMRGELMVDEFDIVTLPKIIDAEQQSPIRIPRYFFDQALQTIENKIFSELPRGGWKRRLLEISPYWKGEDYMLADRSLWNGANLYCDELNLGLPFGGYIRLNRKNLQCVKNKLVLSDPDNEIFKNFGEFELLRDEDPFATYLNDPEYAVNRSGNSKEGYSENNEDDPYSGFTGDTDDTSPLQRYGFQYKKNPPHLSPRRVLTPTERMMTVVSSGERHVDMDETVKDTLQRRRNMNSLNDQWKKERLAKSMARSSLLKNVYDHGKESKASALEAAQMKKPRVAERGQRTSESAEAEVAANEPSPEAGARAKDTPTEQATSAAEEGAEGTPPAAGAQATTAEEEGAEGTPPAAGAEGATRGREAAGPAAASTGGEAPSTAKGAAGAKGEEGEAYLESTEEFRRENMETSFIQVGEQEGESMWTGEVESEHQQEGERTAEKEFERTTTTEQERQSQEQKEGQSQEQKEGQSQGHQEGQSQEQQEGQSQEQQEGQSQEQQEGQSERQNNGQSIPSKEMDRRFYIHDLQSLSDFITKPKLSPNIGNPPAGEDKHRIDKWRTRMQKVLAKAIHRGKNPNTHVGSFDIFLQDEHVGPYANPTTAIFEKNVCYESLEAGSDREMAIKYLGMHDFVRLMAEFDTDPRRFHEALGLSPDVLDDLHRLFAGDDTLGNMASEKEKKLHGKIQHAEKKTDVVKDAEAKQIGKEGGLSISEKEGEEEGAANGDGQKKSNEAERKAAGESKAEEDKIFKNILSVDLKQRLLEEEIDRQVEKAYRKRLKDLTVLQTYVDRLTDDNNHSWNDGTVQALNGEVINELGVEGVFDKKGISKGTALSGQDGSSFSETPLKKGINEANLKMLEKALNNYWSMNGPLIKRELARLKMVLEDTMTGVVASSGLQVNSLQGIQPIVTDPSQAKTGFRNVDIQVSPTADGSTSANSLDALDADPVKDSIDSESDNTVEPLDIQGKIHSSLGHEKDLVVDAYTHLQSASARHAYENEKTQWILVGNNALSTRLLLEKILHIEKCLSSRKCFQCMILPKKWNSDCLLTTFTLKKHIHEREDARRTHGMVRNLSEQLLRWLVNLGDARESSNTALKAMSDARVNAGHYNAKIDSLESIANAEITQELQNIRRQMLEYDKEVHTRLEKSQLKDPEAIGAGGEALTGAAVRTVGDGKSTSLVQTGAKNHVGQSMSFVQEWAEGQTNQHMGYKNNYREPLQSQQKEEGRTSTQQKKEENQHRASQYRLTGDTLRVEENNSPTAAKDAVRIQVSESPTSFIQVGEEDVHRESKEKKRHKELQSQQERQPTANETPENLASEFTYDDVKAYEHDTKAEHRNHHKYHHETSNHHKEMHPRDSANMMPISRLQIAEHIDKHKSTVTASDGKEGKREESHQEPRRPISSVIQQTDRLLRREKHQDSKGSSKGRQGATRSLGATIANTMGTTLVQRSTAALRTASKYGAVALKSTTALARTLADKAFAGLKQVGAQISGHGGEGRDQEGYAQ